MKHCIDIARPFVAELAPDQDIQVMGGVSSFGIKHDAAEFLIDEQLVVLPRDADCSDISQYRPDGNLRDFDVLVKSADPAATAAIEALAKETIGDDLVISVFGLHAMSQLRAQQAHPAWSLTKTWVSDRYVNEENGQITEAKKALFPFAVDMDLASLDNWHLVIGNDRPMPIPHPGTSILNYLTRSISGLRPKDAVKLEALAYNVFTKTPEIADWINDGPGKSQLQLARILQTLREPTKAQSTLNIGGKVEVRPFRPSTLDENPALLIGGRAAIAATRISRAKARTLHFGESQEQLVTFYQKHVERLAGVITHNR